MAHKAEVYIADARNFQKFGQYDLAFNALKDAQHSDEQCKYELEIQRLFSYNYRKSGNLDMALFHINNAINAISSRVDNKPSENEYAICLMNKGIIYEEQKHYKKALECYLPALEIFVGLSNSKPEDYGLIINALLTIGLLYYNRHNYVKAKEFLERALPYFGEGKENDRRYLSVINTLSELKDV
jgi:tetratricopeptide (TPR) repeat protein